MAKILAERPTGPTQVLWLAGRIDGTIPCSVVPIPWPVPMSTLAVGCEAVKAVSAVIGGTLVEFLSSQNGMHNDEEH